MSTISLWTRRDPFAEFDALVRNAFGPVATRPTNQSARFVPAAEISRDGDDALVRVELPGLDIANDVSVEVDRGLLVVSGERRDERTGERDGRSLRELRYGSFSRSFTLPTHVTADAVSASYDAGVLNVRVVGAYAGTGARRITVTSANPAVESTSTPADQPNA
jgi:HSP20 family molecular chaperone IbpA